MRRALVELEQSGHPDSERVLELKRSLLRSIAEIETWQDSVPMKARTQP